jgi:hypothetical protein
MRQQWTEPAAIEAEIAHLRLLALDTLRRRWRVVFGRTPPAALSKDLLGRMIAWRGRCKNSIAAMTIFSSPKVKS